MAAALLGRMDRSATVEVPGGTLDVGWQTEDGHVTLAGPARPVFRGHVREPDAIQTARTPHPGSL